MIITGGHRAGRYNRNFRPPVEASLRVPVLKGVLFEPAIIEPERRCLISRVLCAKNSQVRFREAWM